MTTGLLATADLAAATYTDLFTLPAGAQSFSIVVCNRNSTNVKIRLAPLAAATGTPAASEFMVYDVVLKAGAMPLMLTGLVSGAAKHIIAYSDTANVSVNIFGV